MKNYIIGILVLFAVIGYLRTSNNTSTITHEVPTTYEQTVQPLQQKVQQSKPKPKTHTIFRNGQQAKGVGTVIRTLSDDIQGSRHQRFIIKLSSGKTLLIAHNIDLAPRISYLKVGDSVEFYGVYENNSKGGVIHWTHHDPHNRHLAGWLRHKGRTYQ